MNDTVKKVSSESLNEYRCTRNTPYQKGSDGYADHRARQGYYILAHDAMEAEEEMSRRFPNDTAGFTVKLWKRFGSHMVFVVA